MRFLLHEAGEAAKNFGRVIMGAVLIIVGIAVAHFWGMGLLEAAKSFGFGC